MTIKEFFYPVDAKHSTVLGHAGDSKVGRQLWGELDFRHVQTDGGVNFFNPTGGEYLHVRCKYDPRQDEPENRWYRVRCKHYVGSKWRGGIVVNVLLRADGDGWKWVVVTELEERDET